MNKLCMDSRLRGNDGERDMERFAFGAGVQAVRCIATIEQAFNYPGLARVQSG